jgi:hypothetical protein
MATIKEFITKQVNRLPKININIIKEKRTTPRVNRKIKVRFGIRVLDRIGHTVNISDGGILLSSHYCPAHLSHVNLCLEDGDREIYKTGLVVWVKMYERTMIKKDPVYFAGIKFI